MSGIMTRNGRPPLSEGSRYAQRIRRRYEAMLDLLTPGVPQRTDMQGVFAALLERQHDTATALRITRHLVLERLVAQDCDAALDLGAVTATMTTLAEFALDIACQTSHNALVEQHGTPCGDNGQATQLCIVGMGKLGARELNVSSDIDLIYVYDHEGETTGNALGRNKIIVTVSIFVDDLANGIVSIVHPLIALSVNSHPI